MMLSNELKSFHKLNPSTIVVNWMPSIKVDKKTHYINLESCLNQSCFEERDKQKSDANDSQKLASLRIYTAVKIGELIN